MGRRVWEGKEDSRSCCLREGKVLVLEWRLAERRKGRMSMAGGTDQRKFGGELRAVKMMNWRTRSQSIVYGACILRQWFWGVAARGRGQRTLLR